MKSSKPWVVFAGWIVFVADSQAAERLGARAVTLGNPPPRHSLQAERRWLLQPPGGVRFDASALLWREPGELLTLNDQSGQVCRIVLEGATNTAVLDPVLWFTPALLNAQLGTKQRRFDLEGLAMSATGDVYLSEEEHRWIIRWNPVTGAGTRLDIDWGSASRWFAPSNSNASWEGIAIGNGRLYVANERQTRRILVLDLNTRKLLDDFEVHATGKGVLDLDYSDLYWFESKLWVMCRGGQCVLEVDPESHRVLAQYDYGAIEDDPRWSYDKRIPFGYMEGLAVDGTSIWLLIDNNGDALKSSPDDHRPQLFRCRRPDRNQPKPSGADQESSAK